MSITTQGTLNDRMSAVTQIAGQDDYSHAAGLLEKAHQELRVQSEDSQTAIQFESVSEASASTDTMMELLKGIMRLESLLVDYETDMGM